MITKDTEKKLFILDAYALIFRAYFAFSKNPRINSKGLNTSAIFGFTNALLEILRNENPDHIIVGFDPPGPNIRVETFADYKANRDETPEDIKLAVPYIKEIIKGFNIPIAMVEGYEADDTIGTLAKQAEKEGFTVYMMTPDKDYGQLVSENIFMYKPARMGNGAEVWGIPEVCEKFGVENVLQVIDILGLWGDAVDNIPGVKGIGEKTAKKLIGKYGSIEGIYENLKDLKGKQLENLERDHAQALISKKLATIILDVPVTFDADASKREPVNKELLTELFEELEFRRIAERVLGTTSATSAPSKPKAENAPQMSLFETGESAEAGEQQKLEDKKVDYKTIDSVEEIGAMVKDLEQYKEVCFDTETTSLNTFEAELVGIAFSGKKDTGYYIPFSGEKEDTETKLNALAPFFNNDQIVKVAHNLKYDYKVLMQHGTEVMPPMADTMVMHYLIDPETNRRSMDLLSEQFLNYSPISIETLIGPKGKNQKNMRDIDVEKVAPYATEDADITLQLKEKLQPALDEQKESNLYDDIEMPLLPVLAKMERNGIKLDVDLLNNYSEQLNGELLQLQQDIYDLAEMQFKISSPKQVGEVLFDHLKIVDKPKKTKTGQYATSEEVLQTLKGKHPIVDKILEFREVGKLKSTYVDALPLLVNKETGRIHTTYRQTVAATGRLSSDNPNLQNIPIRSERGKKIREAFIAGSDEFTLLAADYSQVELRIIAALSGDETMIEAFKNGHDIHASTAAKVFGVPLDEVTRELRSRAKTVNFGIIYGISAFGLSQRIGISRKEAKAIIDNYFEQFPKIKAYMDASIANARENGYVSTIKGRRRYLRDINSANATVRGMAERNAINSPIQGSAADIIKIAMINIEAEMEKRQMKSKMLLQVHDELIFDAHVDEVQELRTMVTDLMMNAVTLDVPLEVDANTGANWLVAH